MSSTLALQARPIRPTRAGRLLDYLDQLFPPAVYIPSGIASFLSIHLALQAMTGEGPLRLGWSVVAGALSVVLFSLILRVNDELKDVESDRRLAAEGDPKYRDRALVTGHVRIEDLLALRRGAVMVALALNLVFAARPLALAGFALTMAVLWLSSRWFFWPKIREKLLLAFATHNPIAAVVGLYVVAVFASDHPTVPALGLASVLAGWLPISAWETSRKVRAPADETRYQTYSMLLGPRVAAALPVAFATLSTACLFALAGPAGLPAPYLALVVAANLLVAGASARFVLRPSSRSANLRPFAETYAVTVTVGLVIALVVTHGIQW